MAGQTNLMPPSLTPHHAEMADDDGKAGTGLDDGLHLAGLQIALGKLHAEDDAVVFQQPERLNHLATV